MNNSSQRGFIVPLVIVAVVLILTGGAYVLWQNGKSAEQLVGNDRDAHGCIGSAGYSWSEEKQACIRPWEEASSTQTTADWKTYTSTDNSFSFKYPGSWDIDRLAASSILKSRATFNLSGESVPIMSVYSPIREIGYEGLTVARTTKITAGGHVFTKTGFFDKERGASIASIHVTWNEDNWAESGEIWFNGVNTRFDESVLDTIVSTFKFSSTAPTVSNSKTYSNPEYGFSLNYPGDFNLKESYGGGYFNEQNLYNLSISAPTNYQKGTDFNVGRVGISVSSSTANCYTSSPNGEALSAVKTINGVDFHYPPHQPINDDAMGGQRGKDWLFATIMYGQCYRIDKIVGYRDLRGFANPPYPPHFDEGKANADLDSIVNSFKFDSGASFGNSILYVNDGTATPVITSIVPARAGGVIGQTFTISGLYLNGFEGSTNVLFVNKNTLSSEYGKKGYIEADSHIPVGATTLKFSFPEARLCTEPQGYSGKPCPSYMSMTPGEYEVYVQPWSKPSNSLKFIIEM